MSLIETVNQNCGRSCFDMSIIFERMIKKGTMQAYSAPDGKSTFKKLKPVDRIDEDRPVLIQDVTTGQNYIVSLHSEGGIFYDDGDSQTISHQCTVEKLAQGYLPSQITRTYSGISFVVPENKILARLHMSHSDDWTSFGSVDGIRGSRGNTRIQGQQDPLFEAILKYAGEE